MGRKVVYALKPSTTLQPMERSLSLRRGRAAPLFFQSIDHCVLSTIMMQTLCWTNIFHAPLGFPLGSSGKESACNVGDLGLTPGLGRYPGEGIGYPLQYSLASLVAQMVKTPPGFDPWVGKIPWRREWQATPVFLPGESPQTEGPGGLQSIGLQRVRHDWVTKQQHEGKRLKKQGYMCVYNWITLLYVWN